jgi:hypothetical protein
MYIIFTTAETRSCYIYDNNVICSIKSYIWRYILWLSVYWYSSRLVLDKKIYIMFRWSAPSIFGDRLSTWKSEVMTEVFPEYSGKSEGLTCTYNKPRSLTCTPLTVVSHSTLYVGSEPVYLIKHCYIRFNEYCHQVVTMLERLLIRFWPRCCCIPCL